jgi:hypothetical protein
LGIGGDLIAQVRASFEWMSQSRWPEISGARVLPWVVAEKLAGTAGDVLYMGNTRAPVTGIEARAEVRLWVPIFYSCARRLSEFPMGGGCFLAQAN